MPDTSALYREEILAEKVRQVFDQQPLGLSSTLVNATLAAFVLWGHVDQLLLLAWLTFMTLSIGARWYLLLQYRRCAPKPTEAQRWGNYFTVGATVGGAMWGILGGLLFPGDSYAHQAFLAFVLAGMSAGALATLSAYPLAYRCYLFTTLLPYIARLAQVETVLSLIMAGMCTLFIYVLLLISKRYHQSLHASLCLRYQNLTLSQYLTAARNRHARLDSELQEEISERRRTEAALQTSADYYRTLVETTSLGYHVLDTQGRLLDANHTYLTLSGYGSIADLRNKSVTSWTAAHDAERHAVAISDCLELGAVRNLEVDFHQPEGQIVPVEINATVVHDDQGSRILGLARDISARKAAETALRRAHDDLDLKVKARTAELAQANAILERDKEVFRVTLASIGDAVITTDASGTITYLNSVAEQLTGWEHEQVRGLPLSHMLFRGISEGTNQTSTDAVHQSLLSGEPIGPGETFVLQKRDGKELCVDLSVAPIRINEGTVIGTVLTFRDITEQRQLAKKLKHQATHDLLTGLVNRYEFEQRLSQVLASANEHNPNALLYLDLDQFKIVNDTCGHQAGDDLLRQLAIVLQSRLRSRDTLARLGGDEFGVLLEHCPFAEAYRIANNLRDMVQSFRFSWEGKTFALGVSIGLVMLEGRNESLNGILSAADRACYAAKDNGRNRVYIYREEDTAVSHRDGQMQWLPRIHHAMTEGRLRLYIQPIVPTLDDHATHGHGEILLRMIDEGGKLVMPGAFLPAAERYNQMLSIDRWVVRESIRTVGKCTRKDAKTVYAINLSGQSIGEASFLNYVIQQLEETGVSPEQLCFEITETVAISDLSGVLQFIDRLKNIGSQFALDDFGAGLSSFSYLKTLPVDYIKIDGGFVRDLTQNATDQAMVEAIHRIGHVMGLKTIAEWVEDDLTLQHLKSIGIDYVQGNGTGSPQPWIANA